ncbi:hypothetical protein BDZ89DRAFT_1058111 [Hymenopellis radicata]|nr:hypothetical protein BDZ89DRAFT_1058111 [Hymenopellis radicata]
MGRALYSTYYTSAASTKVSVVEGRDAPANPVRSESPTTDRTPAETVVHTHPAMTWDVSPFDPDSDEFFVDAEYEAFVDSDDENEGRDEPARVPEEPVTVIPRPTRSARGPRRLLAETVAQRSVYGAEPRPRSVERRPHLSNNNDDRTALNAQQLEARETLIRRMAALEENLLAREDSLFRRPTDTSTTTHSANNNRWLRLGDLPIWTRGTPPASESGGETEEDSPLPSPLPPPLPPLVTSPPSSAPTQFPSLISSPPSSSALFSSPTPFNPHVRARTSNPETDQVPFANTGVERFLSSIPSYRRSLDELRLVRNARESASPLPNGEARVSHAVLSPP